MARKYDLISELYSRTCKTVVSSPESWQAFLTSACRNYKCVSNQIYGRKSSLYGNKIFPT